MHWWTQWTTDSALLEKGHTSSFRAEIVTNISDSKRTNLMSTFLYTFEWVVLPFQFDVPVQTVSCQREDVKPAHTLVIML